MKRLTIFLSIFMLSCFFGSRRLDPNQSTLHITNRSGGVVRIFANDGFRYPLGRAWPGESCMLPRIVSARNISFGIQHLAQREVWMQGPLINVPGRSWRMVINQPHMAAIDMTAVVPGERCK